MKEETIEQAAHKMLIDYGILSIGQSVGVLEVKKLMVKIAKWQQEQDKNKYSEEDMISFANFKMSNIMTHCDYKGMYLGTKVVLEIWFEQFKKK